MTALRKTLLIVLGTRPEALKLAPLIVESKKDPRFHVLVCLTGQHREMVAPVLELFRIKPDYDFNLMKERQTLDQITSAVLREMAALLAKVRPDGVVVQGDTTSAMSAAMQAFYDKVPVIHIEAGLRSFNFNEPFPEEMNRVLISRLACFHFAPTVNARKNLIREGIPKSSVFVTGNTIVDAMKQAVKILPVSKRSGRRRILVTAHRRENWGKPMRSICAALREIIRKHPDTEIVYPVHLNPNVAKTVYEELEGVDPRLILTPPLPYLEFLKCMKESDLIITDSGGIQEEAPSLGIPVLVLRRTTERHEGLKNGTARLIGTSAQKIYQEAHRLLCDRKAYQKMTGRKNPYGDGKSSQRILQVLARHLPSQPQGKKHDAFENRTQKNARPAVAAARG
jgi:UDP-N-acetylglucosamine 2-epimerase (non-hydrolysing)